MLVIALLPNTGSKCNNNTERSINFADCALTTCKHAGVVPLELEDTAGSVESQPLLELPDLPLIERPPSQESQAESSEVDPNDPAGATDVDSAWSHADTLLLIETYRQFRGKLHDPSRKKKKPGMPLHPK